jgi:small-conductance mechanosensitive channel
MNETLQHSILLAAVIIGGGSALYHIAFYFIKKWASRKKRIFPSLLSKYIYYPGQFFIFVITSWTSLELFEDHFSVKYYLILQHLLQILLAGIIGFLLIRSATVAREIALHHYTVIEPLDYGLRKAKTKFQLIQRVFNSMIILATLAAILMTFQSIRQVGTTLLASAGVVGLVIGFAAQKSLGTLFAGLQIAISQPIRIDDTVVVEDQFGTIGEITLTYVIVNCWDGRRLIVPISYFLEKPFENWTRVSPEVVSKVKIYADYSLPVDNIRTQVKKWLDETPLWDKRIWGVVVTSASEKTIEVRATMSAKNSGDSWDLECMIREKIIAYIQSHHPESLPKTRFESTENKTI